MPLRVTEIGTMPGMVGRYAGAAGEFGVGSLSETPGPACGVTEMGVIP